MELVLEYFYKDPLKLLYLIGGAGGIWFWVEKWLNRIRLDIELVSEEYNPIDNFCDVKLKVRIRNIGKTTTSLKRMIEVTYYRGMGHREKVIEKVQILGNNLSLPPHEIKEYEAKSRLKPSYTFGMYKKYKFVPTVGFSSELVTLKNWKVPCSKTERFLGIFSYYFISPPKEENV